MPGESARQNGKKGGRPKGRKSDATLNKEAAREAFRDFLSPHVEALHGAQVEHAKGLRYLVARHIKTGKFAKLTEVLAQAIADGTNPDYESIEVWSKDPSIQAYSDLMNRYMDKPKEQEQTISISGELTIVEARLLTARKRLARR